VRSDARGQAMSMSETYVDTMTLTMSPFKRQVVCNGRLKAVKKSDLMFPYQGITMELFVKEGQWVKKGDLIATLDKRERQRNLEKAEHDLFKADVDLTDKLIGLGFGEDRSEVPEELLKRAEVTSGYYDATGGIGELRPCGSLFWQGGKYRGSSSPTQRESMHSY